MKNPSQLIKKKMQFSPSHFSVLSLTFLLCIMLASSCTQHKESEETVETTFIPPSIIEDSVALAKASLPKDEESGLIIGEGFEMVKGTCSVCHSTALITQNRFTREGWREKIVWMQQTQGLWDLGASEPPILDYLAAYYSPEAPKGRRVPLSDIEWYELKD